MNAPEPGPMMICGSCRIPLDQRFKLIDGEIIEHVYEHPFRRDQDYGHEPEPIPAGGAVSAISVCDFCVGGQPVAWEYPCGNFDTPSLTVRLPDGSTEGYGSADNWLACVRCHDDIEADRWGSILERAALKYPRRQRSLVKPRMRELHAGFRAHRSGDAFRCSYSSIPFIGSWKLWWRRVSVIRPSIVSGVASVSPRCSM